MRSLEVELRPARPSDVLRCFEIERSSFGDDSYSLKTLRQFIEIAGELFIVAEGLAIERHGKNDILGYHLASPSVQESLIWLLSAAVDAPFRGLGIGRQMLSYSLATCRSLGASHVRCTVHPSNLRALSTLRSLNFTEIREAPHYFGYGKRRKVLEVILV